MTGRQQMPTALKILRADAKTAAQLRKKQIPTPGDLSEPPQWFTDDQKKAWAFAVENAPRGVLKRIDKGILAAYIVALDVHEKASIAMQQSSLLVKTPKQELPMQNPYLPIMNRQYQLMLRGASELGFTPCARARIESGQAPAAMQSDWDEIASA